MHAKACIGILPKQRLSLRDQWSIVMEKIVRIDMTRKHVTTENMPDCYRLFGGRGLIARILTDEVNPRCDPLGPDNKLIFCPGLLGGTPAPCSGRLSIGAKSPLTGQGLPALGTAMLVQAMNGLGILPTRNFRTGQFAFAEEISGERMAQIQGGRGGLMRHKCHKGCIVQCSQIYNDAEGNYPTSGFEYETTLLDDLGLCIFVGVVFEQPENIQLVADMVAARYGGQWDIERLMGLAVQTLSLEKRFNREAGFTDKDDRLPEFFSTEPLPNSGHVFDVTDEELRQVLPM